MRLLLETSTSLHHKCVSQVNLVVANLSIPASLPNLLAQYLENIRTIHQGESSHHERIDILQAFSPSIRQFVSYPYSDLEREADKMRFVLINTFNTFMLEIEQVSRQLQV